MRADATIARKTQHELVEQIVGTLARRHSTAAVLFHHAVAETLGLGPTDHKCLDLLRERGPMSGAELAAITGLTTGAITGVVTRLEKAGYLHRAPDLQDGRKQILSPASARVGEIKSVFDPIKQDLARMLDGFDARQITAIAEFLTRSTELAYRHVALLRARTLSGGNRNPAQSDGGGSVATSRKHKKRVHQ